MTEVLANVPVVLTTEERMRKLVRETPLPGETTKLVADALALMEDREREHERVLREFKEQVRRAAIEVQSGHSNHISIGDLNDWLHGLGLKRHSIKWRVTPTVWGEDLNPAVVTTDTKEEAESIVRNLLRGSRTSVRFTGTLALDYPDTDTVYWESGNSSEIEQEDMDLPDWLDDLEFSTDQVEEDED